MPLGYEYHHGAPKGDRPGDRSMEQVGPEANYHVCMARPVDIDQGMKFFGCRICPFAHRSWWIALELGLPIEYLHVDMGGPRATDERGKPGKFGKPPWYVRDVNPCGTVPALYDRGVPRFAIRGSFEDDNIGHYLIERYGLESGLIPHNPAEQAAVRFFIAWVGGLDFVGAGMRLQYQKDRAKAAVDMEGLRALLQQVSARLAEQSAGPFFLGSQLSIADIHIAPFLDRWEATLPHFRCFDVLRAGDPSVARLREMLAACRARVPFQLTSQSPEFYIWAEQRTRWNANLVGEPWSPTQLAKL